MKLREMPSPVIESDLMQTIPPTAHFGSTKERFRCPCAFVMKTALLLLASLGLCLVARAESPDSIPNPRQTNHSSIYDGAHVLKDAEKHRIDDAINALEKKTQAQMMVVTIQTLDGMSVEDWSNKLFNRIGVGHKGQDDGALFVFAMQEHKSRLEVGPGLQDRITDARATAILRDRVGPQFRSGAFGAGILEGVQVAATYIEGGKPAASSPSTGTGASPSSRGSGSFPSSGSGSSSPSPNYVPSPSSSGGSGGGILALLGLLAVGGVGGLIYLGTRPRKCPQCNAPMTKTAASDAELSDAERVERRMGSRSFDKFSCAKCGYSNIEKRDVTFSNATRCNQCGNRTARTHTSTLSSASYDFEGQEEVVTACEYTPCQHVEKYTRTVPRLTRSTTVVYGSDSSSSSSFDSSSSSSSSSSDSSSSSSYDGGSSSSYDGGSSDGGGGSSSW